MIQKIIKIISVLILLSSSTFADISINLKTDRENYNIDDIIQLTVEIDTNEQRVLSPSIEGINDFTFLGQSSQRSQTIINGLSSTTHSLILNLKANSIGDFTIGPAILEEGTGSITSNTVNINVDFINSPNNSNDIQDIISDENLSSQEENEEIYGLKRTIVFGNSYFIYYFFLLIAFIFFFYFILDKYFSKKAEKTIIENKIELSENTIISQKLNSLLKISSDYSKAEFYSELNTLFRRYFKFLGVNNAYELSFNELNMNSILHKNHMLEEFKKSYFIEFGNQEEDIENRKVIIKNFIKYLKK